ncbi:glycosyltransferase [Streptomyces sp. NBC_01808]|uniref:glycosyltransferase n=1 Tax=Streptomyces sp. NBC_01808 TaxID=2975947 RepID=UPI002DD7FBA9|nr:glycosyltransferase [Streptomyces sp. NBC_01808]WSA38120.1 glycosyltransferase [Streptomyces sp. NBC_01808]
MRIVFLLSRADEPGDVPRAVLTRASHLAARHDVEVVSVFRTRDRPHAAPDARVALRHLVDRTGPVPVPLRPTALTDRARQQLAAAPSALVDPALGPDFDALTDTELTLALRTLDTDVLVTASPALLRAAADHAPAGVVRIHESPWAGEGALPPGTGECDAVVVRTEGARRRLAAALGAAARGPAAPKPAAIPYPAPGGFRPRSSRTTRTAVLAGPLTRADHAIAAFAAASPAGSGWRLRVFGEGPEPPRVRRRVAEPGLYERVELLGPSPHMAAEWAKASFAVLPSGSAGVLEAYAAGVPAVAYAEGGGAADVVRDGVDGLLVPPDDVDALADAMTRLMAADAELLHRLGTNARAGAGRFAAEGVTRAWEELCAELVAVRAPARGAAEPGERASVPPR